mmetsp:Transcript_33888/g.92999  ORF Transcript_33888/g.92999 Transcript_33888/m.92999 type:complete len:224 (-) Transcript_33888:218-889(-)
MAQAASRGMSLCSDKRSMCVSVLHPPCRCEAHSSVWQIHEDPVRVRVRERLCRIFERNERKQIPCWSPWSMLHGLNQSNTSRSTTPFARPRAPLPKSHPSPRPVSSPSRRRPPPPRRSQLMAARGQRSCVPRFAPPEPQTESCARTTSSGSTALSCSFPQTWACPGRRCSGRSPQLGQIAAYPQSACTLCTTRSAAAESIPARAHVESRCQMPPCSPAVPPSG